MVEPEVARKLKSLLAETAQEADEHLCGVLVSHKKEAGGVQAHAAMLPKHGPRRQDGSGVRSSRTSGSDTGATARRRRNGRSTNR